MARGFSGDKEQLVPLLKAGIAHQGFALIDIISPCVTFNDHEGSTKSYQFTRDHYHPAIHADYIEPSAEIRARYDEGEAMPVTMHDGGQVILRKTDADYDPTDRAVAYEYLAETSRRRRDHHGVFCTLMKTCPRCTDLTRASRHR